MSEATNTGTAEGAQLVGTPGRPAHPAESERGEHDAESVLSLSSGVGTQHIKEECVLPQRRPDRPVRFADPVRNGAYWARIDRIVDQAPPLTAEQRAIIRTAFHAPAERGAA